MRRNRKCIFDIVFVIENILSVNKFCPAVSEFWKITKKTFRENNLLLWFEMHLLIALRVVMAEQGQNFSTMINNVRFNGSMTS